MDPCSSSLTMVICTYPCVCCFDYFLKHFTGVELLYNVLLLAPVEQSESAL